MDDLVTWLRAQLDEDERLAKAAGEDAWPSHEWREDGTRPSGPVVVVGSGADDIWSCEVSAPVWTCDDPEDGCMEIAARCEAEGEHIARHDPARVLREVDAKRRIVDLHAPVPVNFGDEWACTECVSSLTNRLCPTLLLLALPYADWPGYRDEWRP